MTDRPRVVWLRSGEDGRYLSAYLDGDGRLHRDGEDFGPKIRIVTNRDSYSYEPPSDPGRITFGRAEFRFQK
jgi:hypothetical protein